MSYSRAPPRNRRRTNNKRRNTDGILTEMELINLNVRLQQMASENRYTISMGRGQRKYGGPPPGWVGQSPGKECEVFIGKIPPTVFEDELVPLFTGQGRLYEFRLMIDDSSGINKGYGFAMYTCESSAQRAVHTLDGHEIRPGVFLGVLVSLNKNVLLISDVDPPKDPDRICETLQAMTNGLKDVSPKLQEATTMFLVEFNSHSQAVIARTKLRFNSVQLFGKSAQVDWAFYKKPCDQHLPTVCETGEVGDTQSVTKHCFRGTVEASRASEPRNLLVHGRARLTPEASSLPLEHVNRPADSFQSPSGSSLTNVDNVVQVMLLAAQKSEGVGQVPKSLHLSGDYKQAGEEGLGRTHQREKGLSARYPTDELVDVIQALEECYPTFQQTWPSNDTSFGHSSSNNSRVLRHWSLAQ